MTGEQMLGDAGEEERRFLARLNGIAAQLEEQGDWTENLAPVAEEVAGLLCASRCAILLNREGGEFRVAGAFPAADDLPLSALAAAARRTAEAAETLVWTEGLVAEGWSGPLLTAPLFFGPRGVGVLVVGAPEDGRAFRGEDVLRLGTAGLVLGRAMQIGRLQNLLQARFAQIALAGKVGEGKNGSPLTLDAAKAARIMARAFYKEMTRAGFSPENVIDAATEILSQLGDRVKKYRGRK